MKNYYIFNNYLKLVFLIDLAIFYWFYLLLYVSNVLVIRSSIKSLHFPFFLLLAFPPTPSCRHPRPLQHTGGPNSDSRARSQRSLPLAPWSRQWYEVRDSYSWFASSWLCSRAGPSTCKPRVLRGLLKQSRRNDAQLAVWLAQSRY
jgi:hypothetical protein